MTFDSKTNRITVGPGSDFAADSGAFHIMVLRDLALSPNAPHRLKADWRAISEWLGRGDGELTPADYDLIGRAWRYYINRGIAPSIALEKPFAQMAHFDKQAQRPATDVPHSVLAVFDRLLASDAEIAEKQARDLRLQLASREDTSGFHLGMRLVGIGMLIWLPLSFVVVPVLAILGIRWIRDGWPSALLGIVAILLVLPPAFSILLLELKTLSRRPVNLGGAVLAIAYNTAILIAARFLLR